MELEDFELEEDWAYIEGFDRRYEVSTYGRIVESVTGVALGQRAKHHGHLVVRLVYPHGQIREIGVSRVVAAAFLPGFKEPRRVEHIDGDKTNNNVLNLRMHVKVVRRAPRSNREKEKRMREERNASRRDQARSQILRDRQSPPISSL